eukprot:417297_1
MGCCTSSVPRENKLFTNTESTQNPYNQIPDPANYHDEKAYLSTNTLSTSWEKLKSPPLSSFCGFSSPIQINNKEFVIFTANRYFYKYNVDYNQWKKILYYNGKIFDYDNLNTKSIAFHEKSQSIYAWNGSYSQCLHRFNLNTKKCTKTNIIARNICPQMVFVENELHFIKYVDKSDWATVSNEIHIDDQNHMIWNQQTNEIKEVFDFQHQPRGHPHKLIHCKSINSLLIIRSHGIYEYSLTRKHWKQWTLKMPKGNFTVVTTRYNQYLLLIPDRLPRFCYSYKDDIFIIDTKRKYMVKSKVKCPAKGEYETFITNDIQHDTLLCFGYVSDCFRGKNVEKWLIQLISKWICFQNVHIIGPSYESSHFKINVDVILKS